MAEQQSDFHYYTQRLPAPLRNKYVLVGVVFLVWMLFFDRNNILSQMRLQQTKHGLEHKMDYNAKEAKQAESQQNAIFSSDPAVEQFAREKHYMKRANEEVIVVEEK